jgi:hypothetical protein
MPKYQVTIANSLEKAIKSFTQPGDDPDNAGALNLYWTYVKDQFQSGQTFLKVISEPENKNHVANLKLVDQDKKVIAKYQNSPDPDTD